MECSERLQEQYICAVLQQDFLMTEIALCLYIRERQRRRRKRVRKVWTRALILRRKQFGLYDHLMVELRNEDQTEFCNFMRMPPEMFDEILIRIRHIISKKRTWYREPIEL